MHLCLLLLFFPFVLQASPTGFLDLSVVPFQERSFASLDGSWRFTPGLVGPYRMLSDTSTIEVPGYWDGSLNLVAVTYQLQIDLPENYNEPLALYVPEQSSAYRLWVGDSLVAAKGNCGYKPSKNAASGGRYPSFGAFRETPGDYFAGGKS